MMHCVRTTFQSYKRNWKLDSFQLQFGRCGCALRTHSEVLVVFCGVFLVVVVVKILLRGPWPAFWLKLKCSCIPPENGITRAQQPIGSDALVSTFFFSHSTSVGSSPLPSRLTLWGGDRVRNPCLQPFRSLWAASLSLGHAGDGAAAAEEERQLQRLCCAEPMPAPRPPHRTVLPHRSPPRHRPVTPAVIGNHAGACLGQ